MNLSQRFLRIVVNNFPTHEVKAMGLKFDGSRGFPLAEALGVVPGASRARCKQVH